MEGAQTWACSEPPPPLLTSLVLSLSVPTVVMGGRRESRRSGLRGPANSVPAFSSWPKAELIIGAQCRFCPTS